MWSMCGCVVIFCVCIVWSMCVVCGERVQSVVHVYGVCSVCGERVQCVKHVCGVW